MFVNFHMCLIFAILAHEIICRTIDSKTVPTVINALNQSKTTMENTTESSTTTTSTISSPSTSTASNSFDICEYFDTNDAPDFRFHEHGVTVIMRLFWQLWIRQVILLAKLEARFHNAGYENVKFFIVTQNQTNTDRIRNVSRQLEVMTVNDTQSAAFAELEDRSVYIFDSCGRNVYVIHYPFSSVQKPFVKAAVLSTIYDQPCGSCPTNIVSFNFPYCVGSLTSNVPK